MMKFKIKGVMRVQHTGESERDVYTFTRYAVDGLEWLLNEIEMSVLCMFRICSSVSQLNWYMDRIENELGINHTEVIEACNSLQEMGLIEYTYKEACGSAYINETDDIYEYLTFDSHCQFEEDAAQERYVLIPTILYLRLLAEKASKEL
jgi:hypothetical protein